MRKVFLSWILALVAFAGYAQNYMVVDSEKIFKSQADYTEALTTLDELAKAEQKRVDEKFAEVESLYNRYMRVKNSMTPAQQQAQENEILQREQQAIQFQESIFGNEGSLMQRRVELIQPIQKRVFSAIESYAREAGYDLVIDSASNPTLIYRSEQVDMTQAVIDRLK